MTDYRGNSPRRYVVDECGKHVLVGLSPTETSEFEALDHQSLTQGDKGEGPTITSEKRWLQLYNKHERAWKQWMAQSSGHAVGQGLLGQK
jgi:hypothetical protein